MRTDRAGVPQDVLEAAERVLSTIGKAELAGEPQATILRRLLNPADGLHVTYLKSLPELRGKGRASARVNRLDKIGDLAFELYRLLQDEQLPVASFLAVYPNGAAIMPAFPAAEGDPDPLHAEVAVASYSATINGIGRLAAIAKTRGHCLADFGPLLRGPSPTTSLIIGPIRRAYNQAAGLPEAARAKASRPKGDAEDRKPTGPFVRFAGQVAVELKLSISDETIYKAVQQQRGTGKNLAE